VRGIRCRGCRPPPRGRIPCMAAAPSIGCSHGQTQIRPKTRRPRAGCRWLAARSEGPARRCGPAAPGWACLPRTAEGGGATDRAGNRGTPYYFPSFRGRPRCGIGRHQHAVLLSALPWPRRSRPGPRRSSWHHGRSTDIPHIIGVIGGHLTIFRPFAAGRAAGSGAISTPYCFPPFLGRVGLDQGRDVHLGIMAEVQTFLKPVPGRPGATGGSPTSAPPPRRASRPVALSEGSRRGGCRCRSAWLVARGPRSWPAAWGLPLGAGSPGAAPRRGGGM
jgi:hypothetical protein